MKKIILFSLVASLFWNKELFACGNAYYYSDRPLPYKNGFLDYHKIFISADEKQMELHRFDRDGDNPYFFPVGVAHAKSVEYFKDVWYDKLRDTLLDLIGRPKNYWKLTNKEIAAKAISIKVDYKILSDFAWKLARKNDLPAAEMILLAVEKTNPNEYNVIANLGTVYELMNKPQLALQYITKALQVSPQSHYGSEWIHQNILKLKTGAIERYDFTRLFELDKISAPYSDQLYKKEFKPEAMGKYHRDSLMVHLAYQLHERMFFIDQKDPIMEEMLYLFLQCMVHRGDMAYATEASRLYMRYTDTYRYERVYNLLAYCLKKLSPR